MRNTVRCEADAQRTFGCPSIRTDIPNKRLKSVADHQNYGDEPEAIDLLSPATFVEYGISEADFERPRPREEIRALFEKIGFSYKVGKFNAIFNRAVCYARDPYALPENCVSIRCFMTAINDLHDLE
jgi:EF-hand domain-containing family member B